MSGDTGGRKINLDEFEDSEDEIRPGVRSAPISPAQRTAAAEDDSDDERAGAGQLRRVDSDEVSGETGELPARKVALSSGPGGAALGDGVQLVQMTPAVTLRMAAYSEAGICEEQEEQETGAVIRWRTKSISARTKGATTKTQPGECASNARIVTWEDGSQTLHVGAEAFSMAKAPVTKSRPMYIFRRRQDVQTCQGGVESRVKLRPAGRRKILRNAGPALKAKPKAQRIEFTDTLANPEREEMEALSKAAERERLANKRDAARRRQEQRRLEAASGGRSRELSQYMEDDEDEYEGTDYEEDAVPTRSRADEFEELTRRRRNRENPDRLMTAKDGESGSDRGRGARPKKRMRRLAVLSDGDESGDESGDGDEDAEDEDDEE